MHILNVISLGTCVPAFWDLVGNIARQPWLIPPLSITNQLDVIPISSSHHINTYIKHSWDVMWLKQLSISVYAILSSIKGLLLFFFFLNSLIIHRIIHQIVFGYFDLYFLLFITIKYYMKTAQKIVNNSIKENRLPLKLSSLR